MRRQKKMTSTYRMALAALFLALGLILPFLTGQIQEIGNKLLPMHIPVLLCGFVCGWEYGLIVGFVTPILRSGIFGMPVMMPVAACMAFELAAYGACTGLLYHRLPRTTASVYISLVGAMLAGRLIWGLFAIPLYGAAGTPFSARMFLMGGFVNAVPGIILQLVLIPVIIVALRRAKVME